MSSSYTRAGITHQEDYWINRNTANPRVRGSKVPKYETDSFVTYPTSRWKSVRFAGVLAVLAIGLVLTARHSS